MHTTGHIYKKKITNPYVRVVVGGVLVILLTMLVGDDTYNGASMGIIEEAMNGTAHWEAFF